MKSLIVLLKAALQDIKRLEPGVKGLERDVITLNLRFEHEGLSFLTKTLPTFCDSIDDGLAIGRFTCPFGFKRVKGGEIPRFFSGILCEVFDPLTGQILDQPNLSIVKFLRGFLLMFKKLGYDQDNEYKLDIDAKSKFFSCESSIQEISLSSEQLFTLRSVSKFCLPNLDDYQDEEIELKHGPGSVAETISSNQKWVEVIRCSHLLEDYGYDEISYRHHHLNEFGYASNDTASRDSARLITVPKNSRSRRTITIEPCWRQYLQQGFNRILRSNIEKCSILKNSLTLTDQTANQKLALEGSLSNKWATIDLSSASDLLSTQLVEEIFRDKPRFLKGIFYCRSPKVDDTSDLRKFAGMGNATTFPVQSVCFAVLAIAAILHGQKYPWWGNVRHVSRMVRVYGDDIIVPTEHAHQVVSWLNLVGLKVNERKSFLDGEFKESCGVDAYKGVIVTPIYVRHHPANIRKKDPSSLAHYTSLSNMFFDQGMYQCAETCRRWVEEEIGKLPLVRRDSGLLGLHTRVDASEFHGWNSKLHAFKLRAHRLLPRFRKDVLDGYAALLKCLISPFQEDKMHLERSPVRFKNKLYHGWVTP